MKNSKIRVNFRRQGALTTLLSVAEPSKRQLAEIKILEQRIKDNTSHRKAKSRKIIVQS